MTKRIMAIALIFVCASMAWAILGGTIFSRTYSLDQVAESQVISTWGASQNQSPPTALFRHVVPKTEEAVENGKKVTKTVENIVTTSLPLEGSKIDVALDLEHRQKGLLWFSTYKVDFSGAYTFRNISEKEEAVVFALRFPTTEAIYDNLTFLVDGAPVPTTNEDNSAIGVVKIAAGKTAQLAVGYRSQGLNEWRYSFGGPAVTQVRDFNLNMKTNFKDVDFPENTISPTEKHETENGWALSWTYTNLLSGFQIAMVMPEKLQPGPHCRTDQFLRARVVVLFLLLNVHHHNYSWHRASSDELSVSRRCVLLLPSITCVSSGSRLNPRRIRDRLSRLDLSGSQLPAARCGHAFRRPRGRLRTIRISRRFFVCLLSQRLYRPCRHQRGDCFVVCRHAGDRTNPLGRQILP